jgi:hypothetical protein
MKTAHVGEGALTRQLDGELRLVREAILMVASKGASWVVVAGLTLGPHILDSTQRLADDSGVRIVPLWTGDEDRLDIRVEEARP